MNLLSTGNEFTEIILNKAKSTLIIGDNGAGKSTAIEAISFALFGKPFRNINKPQLVNAITGKNMLVELEFSIHNKNYLIRRGMKPNVFEIYCDDQLLDQDSKNYDYQQYLEQNILKLNYKSFKQIVVLGSRNYVPFMQLKAGERREVIEDLLDIQVFSIMNDLLKQKIANNKNMLTDNEYNINLLQEKIKLHQKHIQSLKTNNEAIITQKKEMLIDLQTKISDISLVQTDLQNKTKALMETISDKDKVKNKLKKISDLENNLELRISKINKDIAFFENNNNCPTCKQNIDENFKNNTITNKKTSLSEFNDGLQRLSNEYKNTNARLLEIQDTLDKVNNLNKEIQSNNTQIYSWNEFIKNLNEEIEQLQKSNNEIKTENKDHLEYKKQLKKYESSKEKLLNEKQLLDISSILLKDGGIKTKIVRQFVPIMNKLINKYLAQMDFFVDFTLDEQFNEKIKSRFRDEFSYESFSEGEKMRIDLAILFTWRSISKLRNSMSTNLLILDEIFDSSLDDAGTEEFLRIITELAGDTNVFVISHKGQSLYDKFHSIIKFEKHKSFSKMVA